MKFIVFYVSIVSYLLFILTAILLKIGKGARPLTSFNRLHLLFSPVYLILSILVLYYFRLDFKEYLADLGIGLFLFFTFHYSIFLNIYSLAQRSVSSSLLILLSDNSDKLTEDECLKMYANGKGFKYIKSSRLEDMTRLGWLEDHQNKYNLTVKGNRVIQFVISFLKFWGLQQLGK